MKKIFILSMLLCSGDGFRGILVAYLSATGTTARTAEKLANVTGMN